MAATGAPTGVAAALQAKPAPIDRTQAMSAADRADKDAGKQRKHAWVGGWFPVERPQWVVVVYLHDTTETSSRTAAWVAAQFLQHEAVRNLVKEAGQ
jgi:cell division protein FtsI/penicillin-binding protein 2